MAAIYTTPRTWVASELVTASILNTHVRDNLDYLKARPVARVSDLDGTVTSTTSTSFVDMTGASVSITTSGSSRLLILAQGVWSGSLDFTTAYVAALIDGTNQGDATLGNLHNQMRIASMQTPWTIAFVTSAAVSDGAHTVKLQYRTNSGTLTVQQISIAVLEVF